MRKIKWFFFSRFGGEDNPDKEFHPCKGLFQTCCNLVSVTPVDVPTVEVKKGCGYRNHEGVGFRIIGDRDHEAQYGKFYKLHSSSKKSILFVSGEFPWMVAIIKEEPSLQDVLNVYQCGGSLIHPSVRIYYV